MKLKHKIKSWFKTRDFYLWKELRFDEGFCFAQPSEEILVDIAAFLRDNLKPVAQLEDKRFRLKEKTAVAFASIDELMPWISKILASDFDETSRESEEYGWKFKYQLKMHRASENSVCLTNALTSTKKENSHCVYTLVSIRKFEGRYFCWMF